VSGAATIRVPTGPELGIHRGEASRLIRWGVAVLVFAVLPIVLWMVFAPLTAAVVAPGVVKVDLDRRPVQHAEGGIVREVKVRDGQRVKAGEPLIVLGDVAVNADLTRLQHRLLSERASAARLESEQLLAAEIGFPPEVLAAARRNDQLAQQLTKERRLFAARREALVGQGALLRSQRQKVEQEIVALKAQIAQASESLAHQQADLKNHRALLSEGYVAATKVTQLEAAVSDYGVKLEERKSELARAEQRLADTDLRLKGMEVEYRQQASDQLKVTALRIAEIEQEFRKVTDAAARQVVAAPADGEVIALRVTAPGVVIGPRETVAEIVPSEPRLVVEARVRPEDIHQIQRGQQVEMRFTAFAYRTTRLVAGTLTYVSADRLVERETHMPFYSVLIDVDPASLKAAGDLELQAGMPAEIYIKGAARTPLQYLLTPLTQFADRAARER
jgi:HlyD family secretion protein